MIKVLTTSFIQELRWQSEVKQDMEEVNISGKLIKPDGVQEFWWNGVNYHNVVPEELVDAELEHASKNMEREEKQYEREYED